MTRAPEVSMPRPRLLRIIFHHKRLGSSVKYDFLCYKGDAACCSTRDADRWSPEDRFSCSTELRALRLPRTKLAAPRRKLQLLLRIQISTVPPETNLFFFSRLTPQRESDGNNDLGWNGLLRCVVIMRSSGMMRGCCCSRLDELRVFCKVQDVVSGVVV